MSFKIGQKVVCINHFICAGTTDDTYPVKGEIYTIREIREALTPKYRGHISFLFEEIHNRSQYYPWGFLEPSFLSYRFRPIDYSFGEKIASEITEACEELELIKTTTVK